MARISSELSVEIIYRIAEMLNNEIRTHGQLQLNNKHIWDNCLHQMSNEVWRGVLETLRTLGTQHPELFTLDNYSAIEEGIKTLDRFDSYYDRVLDLRNKHLNHKKIAWKCLMTLREIYCRAIEVNLPNDNSSKVLTTFDDIFNNE